MGSNNYDIDEEFPLHASAGASSERIDRRQAEESGNGDYDLLGEFLEAAKDETTKTVRFPVPGRKGDWILEIDVVISESELKRYNENALIGKARQGKPRKISQANMFAQMIAEKNVGIYKGDGADPAQVMDSDDEPLVLVSEQFLESVGEPNDVRAAVRKFLGDAGVGALGAAILLEAGWSEDLTPLDPTER
ncbi:hypothetical protein [Glutamicibacter sp. TV12E]|uniref:hypothetical protein n=1 Tax=Glutamicibacter sp. TV12E TaxID=3446362 RepID=UPI004034EE00